MITHPESTKELFKRSMGSKKEFIINENKFTAEELSSFIIRSLKEDAEEYLGSEVNEAIISVQHILALSNVKQLNWLETKAGSKG